MARFYAPPAEFFPPLWREPARGNLFPRRRRNDDGGNKRKLLLIEELSINVCRRKGIIFSAGGTTDSPLSPVVLTDSLLPVSLFRGPSRFSSANFHPFGPFCPGFLAARLLIVLDVLAGIDNAGREGGIRTSIIARGRSARSRVKFRGRKNARQLFARQLEVDF